MEGRAVPTKAQAAPSSPASAPVPAPGVGGEAAATPLLSADEMRIVDAVLQGLQPRIDLILEYRLRETLMPLLTRAAETIVQDARTELAATLRDVLVRAVSQEMVRRRRR